MRNILLSLISVIIVLTTACSNRKENKHYKSNPEALLQNAYIQLPLGSVKPEGWLRSQLEAQASGLTGHLDDFWPDLKNSAWKGGTGDSWERGPYYLDGLIPLAYLLDDERLKEKVRSWIEPILASKRDSGWYGPLKNTDRWPLAVANKVLMQYYEATNDERALEVLIHYYQYLHKAVPDWAGKEWRGVRAMENAVTAYWLFRQTGEEWILETIASIQENSPDWTAYYERFPWDSAAVADNKIPLNWKEDGLTAHVVNNAMAIKYPGLWYQQSGDERFRNAVFAGIEKYDRHHGQAGGRFSGDEHLSGKSPDRGTELCAVVEYMYSLEELFAIFGDNSLADRLELLAFNALPGTTTPDMWAHQYDQQSNQVLVTSAKRAWSTNGDNSNIYGLMPNFACCLANMHQGWPKFAANLWMASNDDGLAAVAYGPCKVTAMAGKGVKVTITEETDYPFRGFVKLKISTPEKVKFPLYLRVPGWADSVSFNYKGKNISADAGSTVKLEEKWEDGDVITFRLPMSLRFETRFNNSVSVLRGPLHYSLRIDKKYRSVKLNYDNYGYMGSTDWEILPESDWNYGLLIDPVNREKGFEVVENEITEYPFADRDDMVWSEETGKYSLWNRDAAVIINARGMKIPRWGMKNNSADLPPASPGIPESNTELIQLVPYGSARLRISEFPAVDVTRIETMIR
ncbi:MAG: glycoside hydrolase family 127 protein [Bacteroidales bacterium]|nr:glycoside hydrolase family 127 protein [Bacteroidales bacterium]